MRYLTLLLLAFPLTTWAADLTFTFDAVTTDSAGAPLPAGTMKYEVLQSTDGSPYAQVGEVTTNSFVRKNVGPGKTCFVATATFTPAAVTPFTWVTGAGTDPVCATVVPVQNSPARALNAKVVVSKP